MLPLYKIKPTIVETFEHGQHIRSKMVKHVYVWTIDNFSCKKIEEQDIKSSTFSSYNNDKLKWSITASTSWNDVYESTGLSLFLELEPPTAKSVTANFKFSILNSMMEEVLVENDEKKFNIGEPKHGFEHFVGLEYLFDEKNNFLRDDQLTIICVVVLVEDIGVITEPSHKGEFKVPECEIMNDLGNLLENEKLSDVTLIAEGQEFRAHKAILGARSPVFAAMFEHEMEERLNNRVTIDDVEPDVLKEMLRFIYTENTLKLNEMAHDLLAAADKYALEKLKIICGKALFKDISIETATEILIMADFYKADQLKTQTINFINSRLSAVMETNGWNDIMLHPNLIILILKDAVKP